MGQKVIWGVRREGVGWGDQGYDDIRDPPPPPPLKRDFLRWSDGPSPSPGTRGFWGEGPSRDFGGFRLIKENCPVSAS